MLRECFSARGAAFVAVLGLLVGAGGSNPTVHAQCCGPSGHSGHGGGSHSGHAGHGGGHAGHQHDRTPGPPFFERPPHGGQVTVQLPYFFEVVYQPRETHVYVYRPLQEPLPAQDVRGEVAMQPHYTREAFRFPLRFVPPSAEAPEENHLVAAADVSQVPDGEMTVTLTLDNLPLREEPQVTFRQTFALTRPPPRVTVAPLTEADWQGVDRQQVCPVTGARLGSMGTPLKLLLNDQAVYLCCEGCVAKVRENPLAYFRRPAAARRDQDRSPAPQVAVVPLIAADRAGIDRQQICPVTGGRLGSMGEPIKLTVNGHVLYVCCEGCIRKVQQNPAAYLFRAAPPRAGA